MENIKKDIQTEKEELKEIISILAKLDSTGLLIMHTGAALLLSRQEIENKTVCCVPKSESDTGKG